ncbi:MAG: GNAT family N-acetyltransferase [Chloroflexota bacterium]
MPEVNSTPAGPRLPYTIRPPRPGDFGWIVYRHGALYAREYGWGANFEGLVAGIVADFIRDFDAARERCWIAERDGRDVGCIVLAKQSDAVAKLRLFLVEPEARGLGIGRRLVDECIAFARQAGYSRITLWTEDVLLAARHIYERAGFRMVHSEPDESLAPGLHSETWELSL